MAASVLRNVLRQRLLHMKFSDNCRNKILPRITRQHSGFTIQQKLPLVVDGEESYKEESERQFDLRNLWFIGAFSFFGMGEEKKEDELIHTIKLGVLSMQQGKLDVAERSLLMALKIAQERTQYQVAIYIFDLLANVAFQKGEYKKAEKLFIETMKRMVANGTSRSANAIVDISLKLAVIYSFRGDNAKAEEGFLFCINTEQAKLEDPVTAMDEDTQVLWAMSMDYYARHLMKNSRLEKAKHYFKEALKMSTKIKGEKDPQTIVLLNDLGGVCSLLREYDLAQQYLSRAITLGNEVGSQDLPSFYCNMGAVFIKVNQLEEAKFMCENALRVATKFGNKEAENEAKECLKEIKTAEKVLTLSATM